MLLNVGGSGLWIYQSPRFVASLCIIPEGSQARIWRKAQKIRQVAQQAERPQKVQPLPSQSIQTLKKFFHWRKGEMGYVENDQQKWEDKMVIKKWKYKKTCYQIIRTKEMISSEKKWDGYLSSKWLYSSEPQNLNPFKVFSKLKVFILYS